MRRMGRPFTASVLFFSRYSTFGQEEPITGNGPSLKAYLNDFRPFSKTPREAALKVFSEKMRGSNIFERLPEFWEFKEHVYNVMASWVSKETGAPVDIDVARLDLNDETLTTLGDVGFLEQVSEVGKGTWRVRGTSLEQPRRTLVNFMFELLDRATCECRRECGIGVRLLETKPFE